MATKKTIQFIATHRTFSFTLIAYVLFSIIFFACSEEEGPTTPTTPQPTTVEGTVYDKESIPLLGAEVSIRPSFAPAETTLSDSRGNYKFVLQWPDTGTKGSVALTATKAGYYSKTDSFVVEAGKTYSKSYQLTSRSDTIPPGPVSSAVSRLIFVSASHSFANVKGVGKRESIVLTFEARDSADVPLDSAHQVDIAFRIMPSIDGGEKLAPETTKTSVIASKLGQATTTLQSGMKAGIVQIEASVVGFPDIRATSPALTIHSGPADPAHFTVALEKLNFPALGYLGVQNKVTVQVGDKWGNPVPESTAIYFSTTGGIIQPAALTDEVGIAQVTLSSGNSEPENGFAWVHASTVGDSSKLVKDSISVLFSGQPKIEPDEYQFEINDGSSIQIPFRVFDRNRNPLSSGERITVSFSGEATSEIAFTGDLDVTMPDVQDSAFTFFKITAIDTVVQSPSSDKSLIMTISVSGPNGNTLRSYIGVLRGSGGVIIGSGKPASIVLTGLTTNTVSVHGTGQNETSIMTFQVLDRGGRPIPQDSALVTFEFVGPNGGATLYPELSRTDAAGRVQTALTSGTIAGVIQVVALIDTGGVSPLTSGPVRITIAGGLPDQNHFTLAVEKLNIPGLVRAGVTDVMTVYVGDKYGNPVQPNTAVYFTTTGGYIDGSAFTNASGIASATLRSAQPDPQNGYATVTATTVDSSGNQVVNSALVLFSGYPIITVSDYNIQLVDDSSFTLWFGVHDYNHNPMSSSTNISVSVGGKNASDVALFGDVSTTLRDALYGGYRIDTFYVNIVDKVANSLKAGEFNITIDVDGPNGATSVTLPGTLLKTCCPKIKSLALLTDVPRELTIQGTGGQDTLTVAYQIRDSLGQSIPRAGEPITFEVEGSSGGFVPTLVYTDANGRVQSIFNTGRTVDTVKIQARYEEITSLQKSIFIAPGPPFQGNARMTVSLPNDTMPKVNFPVKISSSEQVAKLRIQVKDRFDNPVKQNTEIIFSTNTGEIRGASFTDANGYAVGKWYGGVPTPPDGMAILKAMWNDGFTSLLLDSVSVTYSSAPVISGGLTPNVMLPSGVDRDYSFKVSDALGNPLAESTKIEVTKFGSAASTVVLTGDTLRFMRDTRDTTRTMFTFHILDTNDSITTDRALGIKISVTGPNGDRDLIATDSVKGAIPPPSNAKFLALVGISNSRLSVTGTGGTEQTLLTYELQDSSGAAVQRGGLTVLFDYAGQEGHFDELSAITDDLGRVQATFFTGTVAETVRVFAQMGRIVSTRQDIIVQAGPPARAYFNMTLAKSGETSSSVNFPGMFTASKKIGEAQVSLGDRYGNPVANNSKVAFSTNAGLIGDTAYSRSGTVKLDWFGGLPYPVDGIAHIVATAVGQGGQIVGDSVDVVYSGQAVISGSISEGFILRQGIDTTIEFTVADALGNPLAEGATITVTPGGTAASSFVFSGDLNIVMPDANTVDATQFQISIRDTNSSVTTDRTLQLEIRAAGPNGTATKRTNSTLKGVIPPRVAGIRLDQVTTTVLTVREGGGVEQSLFNYQILDSVNNPIRLGGVPVTFIGTGVPFSFSTDTAYTNSNGIAQVVMNSDTVAGIVQVTARLVSGFGVSTPTKVVIVGGKPSQNYFTFLLTRPALSGKKENYPGAMPVYQQIGEAQVQVGDRYGNPVPTATPVYFTTNAGVIEGAAYTDEVGFAKVRWFGGNPIPAGGTAIVKAMASGENNTTVLDSAIVTYSGQIMISGGPGQNFEILGAGSMQFSFAVRDVNGNPPAEGTRVTVTASGPGAAAVVLSGDVDVTMGDTRDSSQSRFNITVSDTTTFSRNNRALGLSISVTGPNGSASQSTSGSVLATGGGRSRLPGSIALISTSANEIQVAGTGGTETSTMIFEIRDSLEVPVDSSYKVYFSLVQPNGSAFISPDSGFCDPQTGRITSVVHSGTSSGPIQVVARVVTSSGEITSNPVRILIHAGLPDQEHISIGANPLNVAGWHINGRTSDITVILGDRYGNPVPEGTAVYFSTSIGLVTTSSGFTDANGMASATLYSTAPRPAGGFGFVKATTLGAGGAEISDSVRILFSGEPIIDSVVTTPSNITDFTARFRVYDINENPLAKDNTIDITTDGNVSLIVSRVFPASKLPDTQDPSWTEFAVNFSLNVNDSPIKTGPFVATITVNGQNGTAVYSFSGRVDISAPPEANVAGVRLAFLGSDVISVYDAGGTDVTQLVFEVFDSLGRRIQRPGVEIAFSSTGVDGYFTPETTLTNDNGQVATTFHSGIAAGNINVRAEVVGTGIMSNPVNITITGGKASQQFFSVMLTDWFAAPKSLGLQPVQRFNFAGAYLSQGFIGQVRVLVGDKYGNPVPTGTLVYFTTNAGVVVGTDSTDDHGLAVADWLSGNPLPPGGIAVLKASVLGEVGLVQDSAWGVYSGQSMISGGLEEGFVLRNGIDTTITFRVHDSNGNPIARGSIVRFEVSGEGATDIDLTNDVVITGDTRDTADTYYRVRLRDINPTAEDARTLYVSMSVSDGNNGPAQKDVAGTLLGTSPVTPPSVAGIRFVSSSSSTITVKNAGGTESTLLTFEIIDSVGNVISMSGVPVAFINNGVVGSFSADTVQTNSDGQGQVLFRSDTVAGIAQVIAVTSSGAIQSGPMSITIVGGLPNQNYITFILTRPGSQTQKVNYPGAMPLVQRIGVVNVQAGDKYGNPVPQGTPVSFTTNAGVVQGSAMTDANGFATVDWFGGNPLPSGGEAIVTVSLFGDNGQFSVSDTATYSGQAIIGDGPPESFEINNGILTTYAFTVGDANNNPVAEGSTIQVTASGAAANSIVLSGDINVTTPDTRSFSETQYSFSVKDTNTTSNSPRALQLTISVSGPNGSVDIVRNGSVLPAGAGDTTRSRLPAAIAFLSISSTSIQVTGTGGNETATMQFEVRDSLGIPVDSSYQVLFRFTNSPGGGEFITPEVGYTDAATGQISAIIHSGTRSGVVQLLASVVTPSDTINSEIVRLLIHAGLPDQAHFSIALDPINLPGLVYNGRTSSVTTIVGDQYGNPVPSGTAVYFTTSIGIVTTSTGFTDDNGFATVTLYTGNPRGDSGFGFVSAFTVGEGGATITDSARMLFSGSPILTYTGPDTFSIVRGGSISFNVEVDDVFGNPLTEGTEISLRVDSESDIGISSPFTLGDTQSQGLGRTQFIFTITDIVEDTPVDGAVSARVRIVWEGQTFEVPIASGTITSPGP